MRITVERVTKQYRSVRVLDDIDFTVQSGECLGVIGPNGSGKSTLLRMISGVEKSTAGHVMLEYYCVAHYSKKTLAKYVAVLLQDALPPVDHTVREVLEMGRYPYLNWLGEDSDSADGMLSDVAYKLCLEELLSRKVSTLSGGERQRVAIGKAMMQNPRVLLLDEPTTFLDIGFQMQMMDLIRQWQRDSGLTVIAVLHDLNLAAQYCDRLLVLQQGKQVALGSPNDVIRDELIESVYGTKPHILQHPVSATPQILLQPSDMPWLEGAR